jgi:pectin methylesterase-like acyl-CoA thioesterase
LYAASTYTSDAAAGSVHLGRPWHPGGDVRAIGQVVIRDSVLGAPIAAAPWTEMSGFPWQEARFAEYRNTGPGAAVDENRPQLEGAFVFE